MDLAGGDGKQGSRSGMAPTGQLSKREGTLIGWLWERKTGDDGRSHLRQFIIFF